jgi:hypothetical protein
MQHKISSLHKSACIIQSYIVGLWSIKAIYAEAPFLSKFIGPSKIPHKNYYVPAAHSQHLGRCTRLPPVAMLRGLEVLDFLTILENLLDDSSWVVAGRTKMRPVTVFEGDLPDHEADSGNLNDLGMNLF